MNILRTSLFVLAASSIAFTSCNKKENEILDELEELKKHHTQTPYAAEANADIKIVGKNVSETTDQKSFEYTFNFKQLDKSDNENIVNVRHYKGTNADKSVYEYYQRDFSTTIYEFDGNNNTDYVRRNSYITVNFTVYSGTLPATWDKKPDMPYNVSAYYNIEKSLGNNDYWSDSRWLNNVEITNYVAYNKESGSIGFKVTGEKEGYDAIEEKTTRIDFTATVNSKIYKEIIKPVIGSGSDFSVAEAK